MLLKLFDQRHSRESEVVAGPSSQEIIDLTNQTEDSECVIDLTRDNPSCSSKSKGKSKAQPMGIIDLT